MDLHKWVEGKKTYTTAVLIGFAAIGLWLYGSADEKTALFGLLNAFAVGFLRQAIGKMQPLTATLEATAESLHPLPSAPTFVLSPNHSVNSYSIGGRSETRIVPHAGTPEHIDRLRKVADEIITDNMAKEPLSALGAFLFPVLLLIGGGSVHAADVPTVTEVVPNGFNLTPHTMLVLAGVGLLLSWIGGRVDWKALLANLPKPAPAQSAVAVKPVALGQVTTLDTKQAKDRLDVVLSKVDELAATRLWLQQTEDAVRKEIASVRAAADMMEARLDGQPSPAAESRS